LNIEDFFLKKKVQSTSSWTKPYVVRIKLINLYF